MFVRCTTAVIRSHSLPVIVTCCHSLNHSLSIFLTRCTTCCHSLSFVVTRYHSLSLLYHSLSLAVTRCHSLSLVVPLVVTRCHSLSLVVPLVVTRCTTRLSFYQQSWPDIILSQKLTYYWQIFLLTLKSDSEAILYHCIVCGLIRAIEHEVNLNVTWLGLVFVLISVWSHAQCDCCAIVFWRGKTFWK